MLALPGLMRYLARSRAHSGYLREQNVAVVVEVADDGHADALLVELLDDVRNGRGCLFVVYSYANEFRSGAGQSGALLHG